MPDEVQTIKDGAALLKPAEETMCAMAAVGQLPAFKSRGQWRIKRTELDQWVDAQPRGEGVRATTLAAYSNALTGVIWKMPSLLRGQSHPLQ